MNHYRDHPKPAEMISGIGECAWTGEQQYTMYNFAAQAMDGRRWDVAYCAGWDWINYWPNFLEGMSASRHVWRQTYYGADRKDGVDGWNSPAIRWVQRAFHPYLIMDTGFEEINGSWSTDWPTRIPACIPGETIARSVEVFNDGLDDAALSVRWTARWDFPTGDVLAKGELSGPPVKAGFHVTRTVCFATPALLKKRTLCLLLESVKDGRTVFADNLVRLAIDPAITSGSAAFVGQDIKTRGNWAGKYGVVDREMAGSPLRTGAASRVRWTVGKEIVYSANSSDVRALQVDETSSAKRIAAVHYGKTVKFTIDAGSKPVKVSFYMTDWDSNVRGQDVCLSTEGDRILDHRAVTAFDTGKWLSWTISGRVCVELKCTRGNNAVINGVFFD